MKQEIERLKVEISNLKAMGQDVRRHQERLRELYAIPKKRTKRARISIL